MNLSKIITMCFFYTIIGVDVALSLPTFGTENVHIKVHIPFGSTNTRRIMKAKQPVKYHIPNYNINRKVIHHYRHRKKLPNKETIPELENFFLAELDKPQTYDYEPNHVKEAHYTKAKQNFKIIPQAEHSTQNEKDFLKMKKINDKDKNLNHQYRKDIEYNFKGIEFIENKSQNNNQQEKHVSKEEVIKVYEAPRLITSVENDNKYNHKPQVKEITAKEQNYNDYHPQQDNNYQPDILKPMKANQTHSVFKPCASIKNINESNAHDNEPEVITKQQQNLSSSESPLSNAKDNAKAVETYKGYDSYSAAHVQGFGSGMYAAHGISKFKFV